MKRGFPDKLGLLCMVVETETGPEPSDPDPEAGPDVEVVDLFCWLVGNGGCKSKTDVQLDNHSLSL